MTKRSCATIIMAGALAAACGNAFEHLETGDWRPAKMEPVRTTAKHERAVVLSLVEEGAGKVVREGQLVELAVRAEAGIVEPRNRTVIPAARTRMLAGPLGHADPRRVDFGDSILRAGLVGRREGARLRLSHDLKATYYPLSLPERGVILGGAYRTDEEYVELRGGEYEIQVVRACDAAVFERSGVLQQWGLMIGWGEFQSPSARRGELHWIALDVDCGERGRKFRIEKGPSVISGSSSLVGWQARFEKQSTWHPPDM